jgi:salicylate hydroxylase
MAPPTVIIIGCGVAGPVIALMLQKKGYQPIVLEKVRKLGDAGGSLMLMPNGLVIFSYQKFAGGSNIP